MSVTINKPKSFFKRPTAAERQLAIRQGMQVEPIANTTPDYNRSIEAIKQSALEQQPQLITVNLMQLRPFDGNPRKTQNPKFEEIKESIRMRGLDFAPNITKRPGEDFYIIADGGNTRLQALNELWQETQDPKFWSIRCLFKPWKGDDNEGTLSCLIGHLSENDLRGDLSFVERALAIAEIKAMHEKTREQKLSHRQLSEQLKADGYGISHPVLVRMEQCLTLLYPSIPNILLSGMGKPQIEKLLTLRSNALDFWQKRLEKESEFDLLWQTVLSPLDAEPQAFNLSQVQDELIGAMVTALDHKVTYEDIYFEIDLDEHKQRRREKEFQSSLKNNDGEAVTGKVIFPAPAPGTVSEPSGNNSPEAKIGAVKSDKKTSPSTQNTESPSYKENEYNINVVDSSDLTDETSSTSEAKDTDYRDIFDQFGMTPGMSLREQQEKRAEHNGLTFANNGHQPVTDIWQIFPAFDSFKRLAQEANGLAYDIFRAAGLNPKTLITYLHAHEDITDFTFTVEPLPPEAEGDPLSESIYDLMAMLAADNHQEMLSWTVPETLLVGSVTESAVISDILLVKIFRLIRIVRRMREHLQNKTH